MSEAQTPTPAAGDEIDELISNIVRDGLIEIAAADDGGAIVRLTDKGRAELARDRAKNQSLSPRSFQA